MSLRLLVGVQMVTVVLVGLVCRLSLLIPAHREAWWLGPVAVMGTLAAVVFPTLGLLGMPRIWRLRGWRSAALTGIEALLWCAFLIALLPAVQ
jgi:membrane protein YdbS with pleckstrin-like domain